MPDEVVKPDVGLEINAGLTETKEDPKGDLGGGIEDVDDIKLKPDKVDKKETEDKPEKKDEKPPADKGDKKVEDDIQAIRKELDALKLDKKNLQKALHQERQGKKAAPKADEIVLTDEQLERILVENPDKATQLKVVRYMAERIAKGIKDSTVTEVAVSQRSKAMSNMLLERYPSLAEEGSEMRIDVDQTKENLGIADHPYGDFFAVGAKVVENLPTLLTNAYERGKKDALGEKAEKNRGEGIKDADLTPKGKKAATGGVEGLTKEQRDSAKQMGLSPSATKIYAQLVGKNTKTVAVEG